MWSGLDLLDQDLTLKRVRWAQKGPGWDEGSAASTMLFGENLIKPKM